MKKLLVLLLLCLPFTAEAKEDILIFGEDITAGGAAYINPTRFEDQLQSVIKPTLIRSNIKLMLNATETSGTAIDRVDEILEEDAGIVGIMLGQNDMRQGTNPELFYKNMDTLLDKLKKEGAYILLIGFEAPRQVNPRLALQYKRVYDRLAKVHGIAFLHDPLHGVVGDPQFTQENLVSPNMNGLQRVAERIVPITVEMVKKLRFVERCRSNQAWKNHQKCAGYVQEAKQ